MLKARISLPMMALLAALSLTARAQPAPPPPSGSAPGGNNPAQFAQHKQKELARIAEHLQALQTLQSCVQNAADQTALKACHDAARASMGGKHHGMP